MREGAGGREQEGCGVGGREQEGVEVGSRRGWR